MAIFYENKDKTIMCPYCKKLLTKADSRDPRIHKLACKNCGKWIWFKPNDDEYREIKKVPPRTSAGSKRFY